MGLDAGNGARMFRVDGAGQRRVAPGNALPALVPVHGEIAPVHRGNAHVGAVKVGLQIPEVRRAHVGGGVSAVGEGVNHTILHARTGHLVDQRVQVRLLAVHPASGHQAHQVKTHACFLGRSQGVDQHLLLSQLA